MSNAVIETGQAKALSATDTSIIAATGSRGRLLGIFVSSSTAGTLTIADSLATLVATFSGTAATYYRLPLEFSGTLTITVGGTIAYTVFYLV